MIALDMCGYANMQNQIGYNRFQIIRALCEMIDVKRFAGGDSAKLYNTVAERGNIERTKNIITRAILQKFVFNIFIIVPADDNHFTPFRLTVHGMKNVDGVLLRHKRLHHDNIRLQILNGLHDTAAVFGHKRDIYAEICQIRSALHAERYRIVSNQYF